MTYSGDMNVRVFTGIWLGLIALVSASPTLAVDIIREDAAAVLELFTSQGCPNSPPADAFLAELATDPALITLAYHVDYWDYAGWVDTFGDADYSTRQRSYAATWGSRSLYTPQLVINGTSDFIGSDSKAIGSALLGSRLELDVDLSSADGVLTIDINGQDRVQESLVWLVTYLKRATVPIGGGENQGKVLTYTNVVTDRRVLAVWEPVDGAHLKLPLDDVLADDSNGLVIMVQEDLQGLPGAVLGAASFERNP